MRKSKPFLPLRCHWRYLLTLTVIAAVYFATGRFGLALAVEAKQVTAVWPPSGIGLAALLLLGYRVWPALALGAFLLNSSAGEPWLAVCGVALGNTLEALSGAFLLRRAAKFENTLERLSDVLALVCLAALLSTMVSATIGVISLCLGQVVAWPSFESVWWVWWRGDALGILILAPLLLVWAAKSRRRPGAGWLPETVIFFFTFTFASVLFFASRLSLAAPTYHYAYITFPFLTWAALRLGQRVTATALFGVSAVALWGLTHEAGPFAAGTLSERLFSLQAFLGTLVLPALTLGAVTAERKRAEELISQLGAIVASSNDAILSKTLDGAILSWNKGAERIYGYSAEEVIGRPVSLLVPPDRPDELPAILERLKRGERIDPYETVRVRKDGTRIDVSLTVSLVKDSSGRVIGASAIARDITERKQMEEGLMRHAEELAHSNAELQQFAYVASHDLQEPLRMVSIYTQLLAKRYQGRLDAEADEFIAYAVGGAKRMHQLINDLLAYSRVSTQGKILARADCETVLAVVLANLQGRLQETGGLVTHDSLPVVRGDGVQLGQVFQNLVGNALKFHGKEPPRVHVSAKQKGKKWVFSVRDNGIGIDPQFAERIFVIFQRLHGNGQYPGSGMGLAICKKIVQRHGGKIWVESQPGQGATFHFSLPV